MTRLRTSRPNRSVPKSAFAPGADSIRSKFCSSGALGARPPAKSAVATITRATSPPRTTTVLRVTRRSCRPLNGSRERPAGAREDLRPDDRQDPQGRQAGRPSDRASGLRAAGQSQIRGKPRGRRAPASARAGRSRDPLRGRQLRRVTRSTVVVLGGLVALVIVATALFAGGLAPSAPDEQNFDLIESAPGAKALFGTDRFGRDVLSRVIYGSPDPLFGRPASTGTRVGIRRRARGNA